MALDVVANRRARKWTVREQCGRILWAVVYPSFRLSPRILWAWRRALLRAFGAEIGRQVHIHPTVRVAIPWNLSVGDLSAIGDGVRLYNLGRIQIGKNTTVSQGAHLCAGTHDYRLSDLPLLKLPIHIGDNVWICADAFVGPGVTVADFAILGARAVVVRDVPQAGILAGNPARLLKHRPVPE